MKIFHNSVKITHDDHKCQQLSLTLLLLKELTKIIKVFINIHLINIENINKLRLIKLIMKISFIFHQSKKKILFSFVCVTVRSHEIIINIPKNEINLKV